MVLSAEKLKIEAPVAEPTKRSHRLRTIAIVVAWQIVALVFVEFILYTASLGEEEIFRLDREVGFTHIPSKRITWRQEGPGVRSYFDSDGMREPNLTVAKPAGTYRIAILGDSMVEGLQVPIEETFGQKLSKDLSPQLGHPVQVLNFGNSGYSTAQEFLQLKNKVFKYNPDLVILGYSNRDIYENWSPPDQTITNVRPYALHLPGSHLVVDSSPVVRWMKTPRAKFLQQISWLREYTRTWGLISALETQLSQTNRFYNALLGFFTNPIKSIRLGIKAFPETMAAIPAGIAKAAHGPSFQIKYFEAPREKRIAAWKEAAAQSAITRAPDTIPNSEAANKVALQRQKSKKTFDDLLTRTLNSLIGEMKSQCLRHGSQFCVVAMPCKSDLCPTDGTSIDSFAIQFPEEVNIVNKICAEHSIPFLDSETPARNLDRYKKDGLFYSVHMTPQGHSFLADTMNPFILKQIQ